MPHAHALLRLLLPLSITLASSPAWATLVLALSVEDLAGTADVVIRGTAETSRSQWSGDGKRISTVTRVRVEQAFKGAPASVVEVLTPGGTVDDITQVAQGAPAFSPGEKVVLFLARHPARGMFAVAGFAQGKFGIEKGQDGVERVVRRVKGLEVLEKGAVKPVPEFEATEVGRFVERLRVALGRKP